LVTALAVAAAAVLMVVLVAPQRASAATVYTCDQQAAFNQKGWYPNRFTWCKVEELTAGEQQGGKIVGAMDALYDIAVTADPRSQAVHIDIAVVNIRSSGTFANATLTVKIPCQGCTAGHARGRTAPLSDWKRHTTTSFDFTGGLGGGADRIAYHAFYPQFVLNRLTYNSTGTSFRCDNARYINSRPGCVFPQFVPTLTYRLGGPTPVVARHISDALNHPAGTLPAWRGKTIPSLLHRIREPDARVGKNRAAAVKVCLSEDRNYAKKGLDCDEYPFATTAEGAARGDLRFSARALNASQNRSAGNANNLFWQGQRVLGGDAFRVAVTR
jgi:hypothetical protein